MMTLSSESKSLKYSFKIDQPLEGIYYFELDQNNRPIKLGDGTFGIVFAARNQLGNEFAVKLLYRDQETDESRKRFELEMNSFKRIKESLTIANEFAGVIQTEGGTNSFRSSPVYQTLEQFFSSLNISDYALVTPQYDKTLKQLLEDYRTSDFTLPANTIPRAYLNQEDISLVNDYEYLENIVDNFIDQYSNSSPEEKVSQKESIKKQIYQVTGYEILERMTFDERINNIMTYIYDVAEGLKTLHRVRLLHLDLKPANILIKDCGTRIETVIGDLGFLDEADRASLDAPNLPHSNRDGRPPLALGTRHYRSPEQKDYFDVADVKVSIDKRITLSIIDPKFTDTIIEAGDVVVFSKYKKEYEIDKVIPPKETTKDPFRLVLRQCHDADLAVIQEDERTQVYFYKRQRHRTDLFGFGSLIFELLTCGKSAERFYDSIRSYDNEQNDISSIMDLYRQVSSAQSTEPGLLQTFEPFRLDVASSSYAPYEIVELILKCMLYKTGDIFYSKEEEENHPGSTMEKVLDFLQKLCYSRDSRFEKIDLAKRNALHTARSLGSGLSRNSNSFDDELSRLQALDKESFLSRLYYGIYYFREILELLDEHHVGESRYFFELAPRNITKDADGNLGLRYITYYSRKNYIEDLEKDFVQTKIMRDISEPFVPNFLSFFRRKIRLHGLKHNPNRNPYTLDCIDYQFSDSSPYKYTVKEGDWLLIRSQKGKPSLFLWKVSHVDPESKAIRLSIPEEKAGEKKRYEDAFKDTQEDIVEDSIFYQDLNPSTYYLNILGIYVYHLFFVGVGNNSKDKPELESVIRSFGADFAGNIKIKSLDNSLGEVEKQKRSRIFGRGQNQRSVILGKAENLNKIISMLTAMYAKLVFFESSDSYFAEGIGFDEILLNIQDSVNTMQEVVADLLEMKSVSLNKINRKVEGDLPKLSDILGTDSNRSDFAFNPLISSLIDIKILPQYSYIRSMFEKR